MSDHGGTGRLDRCDAHLDQPSIALRPAFVMRIRSTMIVRPRRALIGSVTTVASSASTRPESISTENPYATSNCSVRPRGAPASFFRARRCSRLKRYTEDVECFLTGVENM